MSSITEKDTYRELGYKVLDLNIRESIVQIRKQLAETFSSIATAHGLNPISSDADILKLYRSEHKHLWVSAYNQMKNLPLVHQHIYNPILMKFIQACGIKSPVLGAPVVVRSNMPDDEEFRFSTHQDYPYNKGSANAVTAWIPLQDIDEKMGALQIVESTHNKGVYPVQAAEGRHALRLKEIVATEFPADQWKTLNMKAGQAVVFSQFLIHRSGFNKSSNILYSLQFRYNDLSDPEWAKRDYVTAFT